MPLPSILRVRRRTPTEGVAEKGGRTPTTPSSPTKEEQLTSPRDSDATVVANEPSTNSTKTDIKRGTKVRKGFAISASISYFLSFVFLILIIIGNTYPRAVLSDIYFFKLDLADIIPTSVPNASLINSIAQSIGLHDFYQVGLWNFCEGYEGVGITFCSKPQNLYWFNPVEILMSELLAGATIALPTEIITILDVLRITSNLMFGFFLTGAVLTFVLIFLSPLAIRSRWWSMPLSIAAFIANVLVGAATIIGSVISFAFKFAATAQSDLNIHAYVGVRMFVFMWLAAGFALYSFLVHAGMGCCCASRRDMRGGGRREDSETN
ncbi:SUR7/PalI family-domain-containing protein [Cercophora newfieldiana]|uniref:SUR7/PalI family-domain-containing protein n=1 Tax=Cercophora newfieldiana TaxID=92897 RepID=A0AA39XRH1_9PEZI|nr:SUR7/PalI family-domain-containing protein [Cercophora newfieldiana]